MREKTGGGGELKLPFVPSRPISRNQFCRSRGRSHIYICTGPADARPAWPDLQTHGRTHRRADGHTEARTDTQKHGRTHRSTDGHADGRTDTQKHGRRRRSTDTDADASARWRTDAKYSCVQYVGGKIVQTRPASGRTHKDLRGVLYIYILCELYRITDVYKNAAIKILVIVCYLRTYVLIVIS